MTDSLRKLITRIGQIKQEIIANREADTLRIALDQAALIKNRLQTKGVDAQGNAWEPYTRQYAADRKRGGYQTGFVDFTRTGRFLLSFKPVVVRSDVFTCTIEIRPDNPEMEARLRGLQRKRPEIFYPSDTEIEAVRLANRRRLFSYIKF